MGLGEEGCSVIADGLSIRVVIRGYMDGWDGWDGWDGEEWLLGLMVMGGLG